MVLTSIKSCSAMKLPEFEFQVRGCSAKGGGCGCHQKVSRETHIGIYSHFDEGKGSWQGVLHDQAGTTLPHGGHLAKSY